MEADGRQHKNDFGLTTLRGNGPLGSKRSKKVTEIRYELQLDPNAGRGDPSRTDDDATMYAVLVTEPVSHQPVPDHSVHIELSGAGSLEAGQKTTSADETTREDGKAYFALWPERGGADGMSQLQIRVDGDEYLLEIIPLTPAREDEVAESVSATLDPQRAAIEARAYQLYEERGREHGRDLEDWERAESEFRDH
jgi:hypothetical protein